jgi:hypothetical protein
MLFQIDIAAVPPLMKATYIYPELDFGSEITFDVLIFHLLSEVRVCISAPLLCSLIEIYIDSLISLFCSFSLFEDYLQYPPTCVKLVVEVLIFFSF